MVGMNRKNMAQGFSLIEILIVIAILGIVSAMAAFAWQEFVANNNLRTAAHTLAGDIALYRQKAVGKNNSYTINFNITNNTYTITDDDTTDDDKTDDYIQRNLSDFGEGIQFDGSFTFFGSPTNTIEIQSRGLIGNGTIKMKNSRGSKAEIAVSITGRTDVQFVM
jgi:prepilin-type N-terminal cleavage/methylation domain-containing protein